MSDEQTEEQWWITIHTARRGPYSNRSSAFAAARAAKKANPNRHVAVVDPLGTSTPVDE
jgi:hypothetical protein